MSYLNRLLTQEITYWKPSTISAAGDRTFSTPSSLTGRYEAVTKLFITMTGDQDHSRAIVYLTDAVLVGGYLYLGYSEATDPEGVSGADQIRRVDNVPDIRNTNNLLYKAYL